MIPTYDMPTKALTAAEARNLSNMCAEGWAKRWAVKTAEAASDIADAVTYQCGEPFSTEAQTTWPTAKWGLTAASEGLPEIEKSHRLATIAQVIRTRDDGCKELDYLPKYQWQS